MVIPALDFPFSEEPVLSLSKEGAGVICARLNIPPMPEGRMKEEWECFAPPCKGGWGDLGLGEFKHGFFRGGAEARVTMDSMNGLN